jgi:hypothetical protein
MSSRDTLDTPSVMPGSSTVRGRRDVYEWSYIQGLSVTWYNESDPVANRHVHIVVDAFLLRAICKTMVFLSALLINLTNKDY